MSTHTVGTVTLELLKPAIPVRCAACGELTSLGRSALGTYYAVCVTRRCEWCASLPIDIELRLRGAEMLPGFGT